MVDVVAVALNACADAIGRRFNELRTTPLDQHLEQIEHVNNVIVDDVLGAFRRRVRAVPPCLQNIDEVQHIHGPIRGHVRRAERIALIGADIEIELDSCFVGSIERDLL